MKNLFSTLVMIGFAFWLYGFLNFVNDLEEMDQPIVEAGLENTDAIVVLTGGSERVTTGIELLESGVGKKLFISGVHKNLTLEGMLGTQQIADGMRECCIALGYQAGSTAGNAGETRDWIKAQNYHSLRLVTANYHMARSLLLFRAAMPDVTIIPHPIAPDSVKLLEWWQHPGTIELLATEYSKYLIAIIEIAIGQQ